jgi:hypothetical protein
VQVGPAKLAAAAAAARAPALAPGDRRVTVGVVKKLGDDPEGEYEVPETFTARQAMLRGVYQHLLALPPARRAEVSCGAGRGGAAKGGVLRAACS